MEALVSRHEGTAIVKDVRTEIDKLLRQLYGEPGAAEGGGKGGGGGGGKSRPRVRGADRKGARQEVRRRSCTIGRETDQSVPCCVRHPQTFFPV